MYVCIECVSTRGMLFNLARCYYSREGFIVFTSVNELNLEVETSYVIEVDTSIKENRYWN